MTTRAEILNGALALSEEERAELVEELLETLCPPDGEDTDIARILAERSAASAEGRVVHRDPREIIDLYAQMKADRAGRAG